ncbi:MAG: hypothetical protein Q4F58_03525, partial [Candidatus Saccharibacteria bacterium]|nr:hypothetical protein [Candidatus Saccharibacteria bacterium]
MDEVMHNVLTKLKSYIYIYIGATLLALVVIGNNSVWAVNPASVDFNVNIAPTLTIDVTSGGVATNNITLNL